MPDKGEGVGYLHMNLLTPQPFRFDHLGDSSKKHTPRGANSDHQSLPHWPPRGQDYNQSRRDERLPPTQLPLPSLDLRFKSDREFGVDNLIGVVTVREVGRLPAFLIG